MKVLILCSKFPFPPNYGGAKRLISICKYLKEQGHQLDMLSFADNRPYDELNKLKNENIFNNIELVHINFFQKIIRVLIALYSKTPFQVSIFSSKEFKKKIAKMHENENYNIFLHHLIRTFDNSLFIPCEKVVVEMTDAISLNYSREIQKKSSSIYSIFLKFIYYLEYKRLIQYEKKVIENSKKTILVSNIDKKYFRELIGDELSSKIKVASLVADEDFLSFEKNDIIPYSLVFVGKLDYQPNEDALRWFLDNVHKKLINKYPGYQLNVIGSGLNKKVFNNFDSLSNFVYLGKIDKFKETLSRFSVSIAPMQSGAGMQTKILDSMSLGIPVISSELAFLPMNLEVGDGISIANSPDEYVSEISKYFDNPDYLKISKKLARDSMNDKFKTEKVFQAYL